MKTYKPYIVFGFLSLFALAFLDNSRGPFFQDITVDLGLKDSTASLLFVATSFVSFCMGRWSPLLLGRYLRLMTLVRGGHLLMALGFAAIGASTSLLTLVSAAALFGVGYGIINVAENILIVDGTAPDIRRRVLSGLHSIYALSSLVAPLVISFLVDAGFDWRKTFFLFALFPVLAFAVTFTAKELPPKPVEAQENQKLPFSLRNFSVSAGMALYVIAEVLISSRLSLYYIRNQGATTASAARYLAIFFLLLFLVRLVFALVPMKFSNRSILLVSLTLGTVTSILGLTVDPVWFVLTAIPMGPFFGVAVNYVTESFGKNVNVALGRALSLQALFIVAMHYGMGFVTEVWGIRSAMMATPVFLTLAALLIYFGSRNSHANVH